MIYLTTHNHLTNYVKCNIYHTPGLVLFVPDRLPRCDACIARDGDLGRTRLKMTLLEKSAVEKDNSDIMTMILLQSKQMQRKRS